MDNIDEAKQDIIELFEEFLVNTIQLHNSNIIEDLNDDIVELIMEDEKFRDELENTLYRNSEKLTHKTFILEGKPTAPSIQNWLKDFIKKHGSGNFDNVTLTKYITYSENGKKLNDEEKRLARMLFVIYRNLKFFPESMGDTPVEKWEIIPIEREEEEGASKTREALGPPKTTAEKEIDELKKEEEKYAAGGLERMAIEEEIDEEKKIEDLRIEANKYPRGSLERRALAEEIKKLEDRIIITKQ